MATPSLNPRMNLPPLPVTPLPPPPSSSSLPPALTVAHNQSAAASEKQDQRPLLLPSSASGDTVITVKDREQRREEEDGEQNRDEDDGEQRREEANLNEEWLKKMQGWLMVLAILVASVTYSAGVNPPGGFWPDDSPANITSGGHTAGNPVLADKNSSQYRVFFAFNTSAFISSMAIIVLLLNRSLFLSELRLQLLLISLLGCLVSLVMAFCAASTRNLGDALAILYTFGSYFLWISFWVWVVKWVRERRSSTTRSNVELETMGQQP